MISRLNDPMQSKNVPVLMCCCLFLVVAPVVPELDSDIDTNNFDEIAAPEGGEETFASTKVWITILLLFYLWVG